MREILYYKQLDEGVMVLKCLGLIGYCRVISKQFLLAAVISALPMFAKPVHAEIVLHGRCHMGECWDQKFLGKTLPKSRLDEKLYSVRLALRRWPMNSQPPSRFSPAATSYVYCSKTKPAYIFNADGTYYAHLLNPGGDWYGYNVSDYRVYWTTCHNFVGPDFFTEEMTSRAIRLGYPLNLSSDQIELNNVLEIMNKLNQPIKKELGLMGASCMLLGLPMFPLAALAELPLNQFSHNSISCSPTRTTPHVSLTSQQTTGPTPITPLTQKLTSPSTSQPPLPSQQEASVTDVLTSGGRVNVQLINRTSIAVSYEVIQETDYAQLSPGKKVTLQDLRTPTTILLDRMDRGNLRISTRAFPGLLEVSLHPTAYFNDDKGVVRIQESGAVYLN